MGARLQGFAKGLVIADKQIKALQAASSGFFKGASSLLKQPQPRVYNLVEGKAEPQGAEQALGQGTDFGKLDALGADLFGNLESDVLAPIEQWTFAWNAVQTRMKQLETMRLEVDSRRRVIMGLQGKTTKQRASLDRAPSERRRGKYEQQIEATWRKTQHKEAKLAVAIDRYQKFEEELSEELAGLIRDAACLKSYFSGCMELCREAHRSAGNALNAGLKDPYPVKKIKSPAEQKAAKAKAKEEAKKKKKKAPSTDTSKTSVGSDSSSVPPPAPPQAAAQAKNAKGSGKSSVRSANDLYGDDIEMPSPA